MTNPDHKFLKMLNVEPTDIPEPAATVPEYIYDELAVAYCRMSNECATAHRQVKLLRCRHNAAMNGYRRRGDLITRSHRAFVKASAIAGVMAIVAIVGWLR